MEPEFKLETKQIKITEQLKITKPSLLSRMLYKLGLKKLNYELVMHYATERGAKEIETEEDKILLEEMKKHFETL